MKDNDWSAEFDKLCADWEKDGVPSYEQIKLFMASVLEKELRKRTEEIIEESYELWRGDYSDYGNKIQQLRDKYGLS